MGVNRSSWAIGLGEFNLQIGRGRVIQLKVIFAGIGGKNELYKPDGA